MPDFPGADCGNGGADFPYVACPSAPPMPEAWDGGGFQDLISVDVASVEDGGGDRDWESVESRELRMMNERGDLHASTASGGGGGSDGDHIERIEQLGKRDEREGKGGLRSFLVGLASGAVAVVLVGAMGYCEC